MKATEDRVQHYHKVVDCQYACPAHTPVPEYIRLIAAGRYTDAYMVNWESNVFPGILGRVCDRPCEPACRRGRIEGEAEEPVAICRLKRVAADNKDDIQQFLPEVPAQKSAKRVALIGAGPAAMTVARDLAPQGYQITLFDREDKAGGMMRTQIPSFRLPPTVIDEETDLILNMGIDYRPNTEINSLKSVLDEGFDAVFIGTGAPKGRDLELPGREEGAPNIHIGIEFLASVAFDHVTKIGRKVIILGGGNTAMDCCRTSRRLGGEDVRVVVRSPFKEMKASPWEIEDAQREDIPMFENHVPKEFVLENGKLAGMRFEKVNAVYDENGRRSLVPTGEDLVTMPCDDVIIAIGQDNSFPWVERDLGIDFNRWDMLEVDKETFQTGLAKVFVGGDAAWGPTNIITAVAHGHKAAISVDKFLRGEDLLERPDPRHTLVSQKMGVHQWSYHNSVSDDDRFQVPHVAKEDALKDRKVEVELGFDKELGFGETQRCLNCDVQTVFFEEKCIECDACEDICPMDCINFLPEQIDESAARENLRVPATNDTQGLFVSSPLKTTQLMIKDEDVCVHCGMCAERCPTGAWDMQKFLYKEAQVGK
ncbi:MAG: FAD-dependent oxidoreductase [Pseudomonadales bacterium]|nr:FAD-dependent oxidoreductase [Pseudomonadales bacterium]